MRNLNYAFLPPGIVPCEIELSFKEVPLKNDEVDRVCSLVFAPNPKTLLPCSDLQVLFSDSVPAEIADWVRKNLQAPQSMSPSSIINGEQVDDDTLIALTRNVGEDNISYINRCNALIKDMYKSQEGN